MVLKILFSLFSLAQLTALAQRIRNLLSERFPDHPMLGPVLAQLDAHLALAIQAIGSTTKQALTKMVRTADSKRDNSFRSLRDHVEAGLRRENEAYRLACEALWSEFEKNGTKLHSLSYDEQTAGVNSLLVDLSKPGNLAHLATIHAVEWKDELDRDNQGFVATTKERSAIRSEDDTPTDKSALMALRISVELLVNVLNSLYALNNLEGIRGAVIEINQYIREASTAARLGGTQASGNEE